MLPSEDPKVFNHRTRGLVDLARCDEVAEVASVAAVVGRPLAAFDEPAHLVGPLRSAVDEPAHLVGPL